MPDDPPPAPDQGRKAGQEDERQGSHHDRHRLVHDGDAQSTLGDPAMDIRKNGEPNEIDVHHRPGELYPAQTTPGARLWIAHGASVRRTNDGACHAEFNQQPKVMSSPRFPKVLQPLRISAGRWCKGWATSLGPEGGGDAPSTGLGAPSRVPGLGSRVAQ